MGDSGQHVRRAHYNGKYPRKFNEKYKELDPEKYADTIEKVRAKGSTPAGTHVPIMVKEILEVLEIKPGERGLDATLGYGGHTQKMLECLGGNGHIDALDVDPAEMARTLERLRKAGFGEGMLTVHHMNFSKADTLGRACFDFILADLGVSSMQIDDPERGFSYKTDGPLDLRMDQSSGITAAERIRELSREEFAGMLEENSDEPYADIIAEAVFRHLRKKDPVDTTTELKDIIEEALIFVPEKERYDTVKKTCQRVFQALRIDVNSEFEALEAFLDELPSICASGCRIAVLTFHSGEDRLVKRAFRDGFRAGIYSSISDDVIRPSKEECVSNSRAHSTKLRWAVRA